MVQPDRYTGHSAAGEGVGAEPMAPTSAPEIGFSEIQSLLNRNWKLILLLALAFGVVAAAALNFVVPTFYLANAKLLITPLTQGYAAKQTGVGHYRVLALSDKVVGKANSALVSGGTLAEGTVLRVGREMDARTPPLTAEGRASESEFLILVARHRSPEVAAEIVNTWARVVVEEGRETFRGIAAGSEQVLGSQLDPTNIEIERTRSELSGQLEELGKREAEAVIGWDRRISAVRQKLDAEVGDFNTATRRLMEETIASLLAADPAGGGSATRFQLREIAGLRAQLARTPRVLTLEKAPSDDSLSEMLAEGRATDRFDRTLVTEEINPLHDQLAMRVLGLESELKSEAGSGSDKLANALVEMEKTQLQRSAGLRALEERFDLELRVLQLRRGRALEDLRVEGQRVRADYDRRLKQLSGLANELSGQLTKSVVSRVLEQVEVVKLAAAATPPKQPMPKQALMKVAVAIFLGALLGLMIALFRSASPAR